MKNLINLENKEMIKLVFRIFLGKILELQKKKKL